MDIKLSDSNVGLSVGFFPKELGGPGFNSRSRISRKTGQNVQTELQFKTWQSTSSFHPDLDPR